MSNSRQSIASPSPWIARFSGLARGPVLDVACGTGRHTAHFVERGLRVTAVDRDIAKLGTLRDHRAVTAIEDDLEADAGAWRPDPESYATVVVTNYLWRPLLPALVDAVQPDGLLLYETFAVGNASFGKPSNPDFLLRPGELLDVVAGRLTVLAYEHGEIGSPARAVVQRICAKRGDAPEALGG